MLRIADYRVAVRSVSTNTHLGSRRKPHRDVGGLHRLSHHPTSSSIADGFATRLADGIVLLSITKLLSEPFALYLPAQFAGYPLHEPKVALSEPGICFVTHAAQSAVWTLIGEN